MFSFSFFTCFSSCSSCFVISFDPVIWGAKTKKKITASPPPIAMNRVVCKMASISSNMPLSIEPISPSCYVLKLLKGEYFV